MQSVRYLCNILTRFSVSRQTFVTVPNTEFYENLSGIPTTSWWKTTLLDGLQTLVAHRVKSELTEIVKQQDKSGANDIDDTAETAGHTQDTTLSL